ncbi:MAG: hypothetical protein QOD01_1382, partial [Actinomycetota bacterium]|nr:hypothetical protein [Actinomycetota bacterium]
MLDTRTAGKDHRAITLVRMAHPA